MKQLIKKLLADAIPNHFQQRIGSFNPKWSNPFKNNYKHMEIPLQI